MTHDKTARVHDERLRLEQRFNVFEEEEALAATRDQTRRRRVQDERRAFDFRRQRGDARVRRGAPGSDERRARVLRLQTPYRDAGDHELMGGPRRRRER